MRWTGSRLSLAAGLFAVALWPGVALAASSVTAPAWAQGAWTCPAAENAKKNCVISRVLSIPVTMNATLSG